MKLNLVNTDVQNQAVISLIENNTLFHIVQLMTLNWIIVMIEVRLNRWPILQLRNIYIFVHMTIML